MNVDVCVCGYIHSSFYTNYSPLPSPQKGFFINAYFGFSNNDFYMIKYCGAAGASNTIGCLANNYTCWVRNTMLFGTTERLIFAMVQDTPGMYVMHTDGMAAQGSLGTSGSPYFPTQRLWYNQINLPGWANQTYSFASGGFGESYSAPFAGGVAAADRWGAEPCNPCVISALMSSPVPAIVRSVSSSTFPTSLSDALMMLNDVQNVEYPYPYPILSNYSGPNGTFVGSVFINCSFPGCGYTKNLFPWTRAIALAQAPSVFRNAQFYPAVIASDSVYTPEDGFYRGPWLPNYRGWIPLSLDGTSGSQNASLGWVYVAMASTGNYAYGAYVNSSYMDQACPGLNSFPPNKYARSIAPCPTGTMFNMKTASCVPLSVVPNCGMNTMYNLASGTCVANVKYNETVLVDGVCVPDCTKV